MPKILENKSLREIARESNCSWTLIQQRRNRAIRRLYAHRSEIDKVFNMGSMKNLEDKTDIYGLNYIEQQIIIYHFIEEKSLREISNIMNISYPIIVSSLKSSLEKLKKERISQERYLEYLNNYVLNQEIIGLK